MKEIIDKLNFIKINICCERQYQENEKTSLSHKALITEYTKILKSQQ